MFSSVFLGIWLGTLSLPGAELPFNFDLNVKDGKTVLIIHNADERIYCDEVLIKNDSLFVQLPVYDSEFKIRFTTNEMSGTWINHGRKGTPVIPFHAIADIDERFRSFHLPKFDCSGKWETWFDAGTNDSSLAIGLLNQNGNKVTGTFLSETGDHRFIEGIVDDDSLKLSVFDGSHCWLYLARYQNGIISGMQWSGDHYKGKWTAKLNDKIKLRDPKSITRIDGPLVFTFPDADSNLVSFPSEKYGNKVVVIQILGTWCPNCLDETTFLSEYYKKHHEDGVEIIGLAFERFTEFSIASANVKRLVKKLNIDYPILITSESGATGVTKSLPSLKNFISFPTSIIIGRDGKVKEVSAGFSGPATGSDYENFQNDFQLKINHLLRE